MDKKVTILLSTYNGEKYIKEQIDSILNQTYTNIQLIVRDDGSCDKTVSILKQYEKEKKLVLYIGENKGFVSSFFELLKKEQSDYYAFADQDDVWKDDKIERAVNKLEKEDANIPLLYCSNYTIYDEHRKKEKKHKSIKNVSFANSLVECIAPGMTMVINKKAADTVLEKSSRQCYYHDWWLYMICVSLGKVVYDDYSSVIYRRHIGVETKKEQNWIKVQIWRLKQIFYNGYFKKVREQIQSFYNEYKDELLEEHVKIIQPFILPWSIKNVIKKLIYKKPYRNGILDEILIRLLFIVNVI